jgi:hypothetical protein
MEGVATVRAEGARVRAESVGVTHPTRTLPAWRAPEPENQVACRGAGQPEEYQKALAQMINRFEGQPEMASSILYTCVPFADTRIRYDTLVHLAEAEITEHKDEYSQRLLSAAQVRAQLVVQKGYGEAELPSQETIRVKLNALGYRLRSVQKSVPQKN